jgi:hypothetical protein
MLLDSCRYANCVFTVNQLLAHMVSRISTFVKAPIIPAENSLTPVPFAQETR